MQGFVQESVQAQFFSFFFGPQGTKMTFQRFSLRHHLALFMGFLSSVEGFLVGLTTSRPDLKNMVSRNSLILIRRLL